jgi:hypothetical protein
MSSLHRYYFLSLAVPSVGTEQRGRWLLFCLPYRWSVFISKFGGIEHCDRFQCHDNLANSLPRLHFGSFLSEQKCVMVSRIGLMHNHFMILLCWLPKLMEASSVLRQHFCPTAPLLCDIRRNRLSKNSGNYPMHCIARLLSVQFVLWSLRDLYRNIVNLNMNGYDDASFYMTLLFHFCRSRFCRSPFLTRDVNI